MSDYMTQRGCNQMKNTTLYFTINGELEKSTKEIFFFWKHTTGGPDLRRKKTMALIF